MGREVLSYVLIILQQIQVVKLLKEIKKNNKPKLVAEEDEDGCIKQFVSFFKAIDTKEMIILFVVKSYFSCTCGTCFYFQLTVPAMTVDIVTDLCCRHYYERDAQEMKQTHSVFLLASKKGPKIMDDTTLQGKKVLYFLAYEVKFVHILPYWLY